MAGQTIDLWFGELTDDGKDNNRDYWPLLDQIEQNLAGQFKNTARRDAYIESRARLRLLLGRITHCDPGQLRIALTEYGKPYLPDFPEFAFNLSHTANKLVVATGHRCLLGVDIETVRPRTNLVGLVEKCFAEEEQAYWRQLPETDQTEAFYRFWVRKEAFVKAVGRGISMGMDTVVIDPLNPRKLQKIPEAYGRADEWRLHDFDISPAVCGAMAVKTVGLSIILCWHKLPEL